MVGLARPAAALVLADVLRRPGVVQLAVDQARLLAPLGRIEDDAERDALVADLLDDLLLPLGSVATARGLHAGRSAVAGRNFVTLNMDDRSISNHRVFHAAPGSGGISKALNELVIA